MFFGRLLACFLGVYVSEVRYFVSMTTTIPQGSPLLDVLKKKMRQTKEEMERYKDECEEFQKRLQLEVMRREEVSRQQNATNFDPITRQDYGIVAIGHGMEYEEVVVGNGLDGLFPKITL